MDEITERAALAHLYHPTGAKIDIPLPVGVELTQGAAELLIRSVDNLLLAGFTVYLPNLEEGEQMEQIVFVVRREKSNNDGSVTPIIDLYSQAGAFRQLGVYLNTEADVAAFEAACGLSLYDIPLYEADNTIERGKNPKLDKYVYQLPNPAKAVFKLNPRWEGEGDKKHAKRMFVRWDGVRAPAVQQAVEQTRQPAPAPEDSQPVEYPKMSGDLVKALASATGLKVTAIAQTLARHPGKSITYRAALELIGSSVGMPRAA